jgi:hypothetical protein
MRLLGLTCVLRCAWCGCEGLRVKISHGGIECPKWRRAWNRKLRKLKEAGWLTRKRKGRVYGLCPTCRDKKWTRGIRE